MSNKKHGLTIRGDSLYCPLPLALESYWWCEPDCLHCYFRGLNRVWGKDLRPISLEALDRKLAAGPKNKNPKTPLAHCLARKKTIRAGNKSDGFQPIERKLKRTTGAIKLLIKHNWTFVIQSRFPSIVDEMCEDSLHEAHEKGLVTLLPIISPGLEMDWEIFERKRTDPIDVRVSIIRKWVESGFPIGVQGEPYIPGFHQVKNFEETLKLLKSLNVRRYNVYNFHFTPFVAKRLAKVPGVDIEKIWYYNRDVEWKKILPKLLELGDKYDIILGCPDFVNSGPSHVEKANTCCGIDVPNPTTFNTHYFKKLAQEGLSQEEILERTYDGSADYEEGKKVLSGERTEFFTLRDAGICLRKGKK